MDIEKNIQLLKQNVPEGVRIIAVSKTRTLEEMEIAYNLGLRDFGENKVQEFEAKYDSFHQDVRWHIIGHLQRNKVKYIAGKVFLIHSVDSIRLLKEIESQYEKINQCARILIQINIGREESKSGILIEELEELIKEVELCRFVKVHGLMAIIPKGEEARNRQYFRNMKEVFEGFKLKKINNLSMEYLSMGMSGDFGEAIKEGSNMVRIGEGIFGKRINNNNL
ncbi:MAG: YggS family pyridoxal phosphate-dependent enzyme [Bacillota bacterium]|nr:YggS family pyridoxal phosphate-dependent enzyme [Bacillota bacterium]